MKQKITTQQVDKT